ncbi:MAG: YfiR family protein [Candidatus Sulfotelmatobacter sp.]
MDTLNLQCAVDGPRSKGRIPGAAHRGLLAGYLRFLAVRFFPAFLLALFIASIITRSQAQQTRPTESQVKAAYLFNFGRFVRWPVPADSVDSLQICVLGKNSFGTVLDATVKGEAISGKPVTTRNIPSMREADGCHILFVSMSEEARLSAVLASAKRLPALTVSDIPRFAERGGMIGLVNQADRIRFEVNVAPIEDSGLTVSSELLKVALRVIRKRTGGD